MLPSPSLGPPLLSGSESPPLPCWIGLADGAGAVACAEAGVLAGVVTGVLAGAEAGVLAAGCFATCWWCAVAAGFAAVECADTAVPQPAATAASSANPAAERTRVSDMVFFLLLGCIGRRPP